MKSDRHFQVWEYQVSHGMLLVRSPQTPGSADREAQTTNVDLLFTGVEYMALPRSMHGLELTAPTPQELSELQQLLGRPIAAANVTVLATEGKRFAVVASRVTVTENDWDPFESPIEFRSQHHA